MKSHSRARWRCLLHNPGSYQSSAALIISPLYILISLMLQVLLANLWIVQELAMQMLCITFKDILKDLWAMEFFIHSQAPE